MAFQGHLLGSSRKSTQKMCLKIDDLGAVPLILKRTGRVPSFAYAAYVCCNIPHLHGHRVMLQPVQHALGITGRA